MAKKCLGEINGLANNLVPSLSRKGENYSDSGDSVNCENFDYTDSDENAERDADWCEQKVKIDKRRIDSFANENQKTCVDYLNEVMTLCHVRVNGAAGLRNGLRLKKDPVLKISGRSMNVERAKAAIYEKLGPRSGGSGGSKVVLKMDIGHMEHSHIIGKSGHSIKAVMDSTRCHIHFPDSNRTNTEEKSNQVSVSGTLPNVEEARNILRSMQQLEVSFEIPDAVFMSSPTPIPGSSASQPRTPFSPPMHGSSLGIADISNPTIQKIGQRHEINISIERAVATRSCDDAMYDNPPQVVLCTTKGSVSNLEKVKAGTRELIDYLTQNCTFPIVVTSTMDISPQHQQFVFGKDHFLVQRIINQAGCYIGMPHFPNKDQPLTPRQKALVYIVGNIDNVIAARQQLVGHLPVVFMFDVPGDLSREQTRLEQMGVQYNCQVSVKFRSKQQSSNIVIKTHEKNVSSAYEMRRMLGFEHEPNPCGEHSIIPIFGSTPSVGSSKNVGASGEKANARGVSAGPRFQHQEGFSTTNANPLLQLKNPVALLPNSDLNANARVNTTAVQNQLYHQVLLSQMLQTQNQNLMLSQQLQNSSPNTPNIPHSSGSSSPNNALPAHSPHFRDPIAPQLDLSPIAIPPVPLTSEDLLRQLTGASLTPNLLAAPQIGIPQPMTLLDMNSNPVNHQQPMSNSCSPQEHYSPPISEPFKSHYHNVNVNSFKNSLPPRLHKSRQNRQQRERSSQGSAANTASNSGGSKSQSHLQAPTEHSGDERNSISSDNNSASPNDKAGDVNMDSVNNNATNPNNNNGPSAAASVSTNHALTRQRSVESAGQSKTRVTTTNENAVPGAAQTGARKKTNSGVASYADCAKRLAIITSDTNNAPASNKYQGSFSASLNMNNSLADLLMLSHSNNSTNSSSSPSINQLPLSSCGGSGSRDSDLLVKAKTVSAADLLTTMDSNNNDSSSTSCPGTHFISAEASEKPGECSPLLRQNSASISAMSPSPGNFPHSVCSSTGSTNSSTPGNNTLTMTPEQGAAAVAAVTSQHLGSMNFNDSNSRQVLADSAFFTSFLLEQDRMRLAAQSAIEQDVGSRPEVRVPNLGWAGLGFSRSMPINSLKDLGLGAVGGARVAATAAASNLLGDKIREDEESFDSTDTWNQDEVVHPSDQRQRISKHGAPGDRPLPTPDVTSSSARLDSQPLRPPPIFASRNTFAASNQVDVLSKLYKRTIPPNTFTFDLQQLNGGGGDNKGGASGALMGGGCNPSSLNSGVGTASALQCPPIRETVTDVLTNSGLAKYIELFREQEISDMETFLSLTESDLRALGITFGARRKLELEIKSRKMGRLQPVQEQVTCNQATTWYT